MRGRERASAAAIARYRKDFRAFAREQLKIRGEPFKFWPCQQRPLEVVERQFREQGFVRTVWLKARQTGSSTLAEALVAWRTMLWPHTNAIVIADTAPRARSLYEIAQGFYSQLDEVIKPQSRYVTKWELVFENPSAASRGADPGLRSKIVVDSAAKKNVAIAARWDLVHWSEAGRISDPKPVLDGMIPAVHRDRGSVVIIESTADAQGAWFRDFVEASERGETGFELVFVPWMLQPEYYVCLVCGGSGTECEDPAHRRESQRKSFELTPDEQHLVAEYQLTYGQLRWMREKVANLGHDWNLFRQSYPLCPEDAWIQEGSQVFPDQYLRKQKLNIRPPIRRCEVQPGPRVVDAPHGRLAVWKGPEVGKAYDIGADLAMGGGRDDRQESDDAMDYSLLCVIERKSNEQVAEFRTRQLGSLDVADVLFWLGMWYNTAQVAVEVNGPGGSTNAQLARMGYLNQYIWRYRDERTPRFSKKTGWECLHPDSRVLTADLRWVPAGHVEVGEQLLGCQESPPVGRGLWNTFRVQRVVARESFVAPLVEVMLDNGQKTRVSSTHPFWVYRQRGLYRKSSGNWRWVEACEVVPGDVVKCLPVWETLRTYEAGRLSAFLDGGGHLTQGRGSRAGFSLMITQAEGALAQEIIELWHALGFKWAAKHVRHKSRPHEKTQVSSGVQRTAEVLRGLGCLRPTRLLRKFLDHTDLGRLTLKGVPNATIVETRSLGSGTVVGLTTGPDHTLIADGIVGHNTSPRSKQWLVGFAVHELMNNRVVIRSETLLKEMEGFVRVLLPGGGTTYQAAPGFHDDACMAWMIALLVSDDENFEKYYGMRKSLEDGGGIRPAATPPVAEGSLRVAAAHGEEGQDSSRPIMSQEWWDVRRGRSRPEQDTLPWD